MQIKIFNQIKKDGKDKMNDYKIKNNKKLLQSVFILLSFILIAILAISCSSKTEVTLYFASYEDNSAYLSPETRGIIKNDDFYKNIVEEIIKGPQNGQLFPTLPSDIKVNSLKLENDLAVVDFSREIITNITQIPHSSTTELLAIFSIVDTLTEFDEIKAVRFTVEGKQSGQIDGLSIEDFWGHMGIYEDFTRNEQVLTKGEIE